MHYSMFCDAYELEYDSDCLRYWFFPKDWTKANIISVHKKLINNFYRFFYRFVLKFPKNQYLTVFTIFESYLSV